MMPMSLKKFNKLKISEFSNGAVLEEIAAALKERERFLNLCTELDVEMDGVRCPASAAAILNALRGIVTKYQ